MQKTLDFIKKNKLHKDYTIIADLCNCSAQTVKNCLEKDVLKSELEITILEKFVELINQRKEKIKNLCHD